MLKNAMQAVKNTASRARSRSTSRDTKTLKDIIVQSTPSARETAKTVKNTVDTVAQTLENETAIKNQ
ncbi:unnamed protein product [Caenorhabditis angaria]|uniref:Uncharacterized protein n=1 Tax=Caenorhabditis angaria TaxID=860376 RepID=A0A9P1ILK0_9PELO|nr:unnamed protein product [Caenorhabditis angaria]